MKNLISRGDVIDIVATGDIVGGHPYKIGDMVGVAVRDAADGDTVGMLVQGVVELPKASGTAWTQGDTVALNAAGTMISKGTGAGTVICGHAAAGAASGDTVGLVRLGVIGIAGA